MSLYDEITHQFHKPNIPSYIINNLKYNLFDWQKEAIQNFLFFEQADNKNKIIEIFKNIDRNKTHLMFNMATGSGKTLIMSALILYYYNKGYRHFLFLNNRNNIVGKTENNLVNKGHNKYLFSDNIIINNKNVTIKKVNSFNLSTKSIEICFTSIQKLYNDIHIEKENSNSLQDLLKLNLVIISDEAHHFNSFTKRTDFKQSKELTEKSKKEDIERLGWEHTIVELLLNKKNSRNVLLEFTATIPNEKSVEDKYSDKIIAKFTTKDFIQKGYTKEINLISSTLDKKERVLYALIFSWYRHKLALKHGYIPNFKPVVLFRSKNIDESKKDYNLFLNWIDSLCSDDFIFLSNMENKINNGNKDDVNYQGKSRLTQLLKFIDKNNINYSDIVEWMKYNYRENNVIITNSKSNKNGKEKTDKEIDDMLNSLENPRNNIRAIFTVDRLTEGWDVLNLFDIVRLYKEQPQGGSTKKTPDATVKEVQLIGRGIRYYPFTYKDQEPDNKRKFDNDVNNEFRILEELFYHTYDEESRYISQLRKELEQEGLISHKKLKSFKLKEKFLQDDFFKNSFLFYNSKLDNPNKTKQTMDIINNPDAVKIDYKINMINLREETIGNNNDYTMRSDNNRNLSVTLKNIERNIVLKAINIVAQDDNSIYRFNNIKNTVNSIEDIIHKLNEFKITFIVKDDVKGIDEISSKDKLEAIIKLLHRLQKEINDYINPYIGSQFELTKFLDVFREPKTKYIEENSIDYINEMSLHDKDWYMLNSFIGNNEEKELVNFIKHEIRNLSEKYNEVYLLRNEEKYKIYSFKNGNGFCPDFILFLRVKRNNLSDIYQILIEVKGNQFKDNNGLFKGSAEGWKEEFLNGITKKYGMNNPIAVENDNYRLLGLPFFNLDSKDNFENEYNKILSK